MIELRGLHLGNIARSPAESVRPDLWPDHAWVPALGRTGGVLYDLCGWAHAAPYSGSLTWSRDAITLDGAPASAGGCPSSPLVRLDGGRFEVLSIVSAATWMAAQNLWSAGPWSFFHSVTARRIAMLVVPSANYGDANNSSRLSLAVSPDGGPTVTSAVLPVLPPENSPVAIVAGWDGTELHISSWELAGGGESSGRKAYSSPPFFPSTGYPSLILGQYLGLGTQYKFYGNVFATMIFRRALAKSQRRDLAADPLLPFRRRQPVYYSVPSGGGTARSLTLGIGSYTVTGASVTLSISRALNLASSSYAVAGSLATTTIDRQCNLVAGSYAITGAQATLSIGRAITADIGTYAVSGFGAGLAIGRALNLASGSYVITGSAAGLLSTRQLTLASGSYTTSGADAQLDKSTTVNNYALPADPGTYAATDFPATVTATRSLNLASGSYVVTGQPATLAAGKALQLVSGSYVVTGAPATLSAKKALTLSIGSYTVIGFDADLNYATLEKMLDASPGPYAITGQPAPLVVARKATLSPISYAVTGSPATFSRGRTLVASDGSYVVSGSGATSRRTYAIAAAPGTIGVSGAGASLLLSRTLPALNSAYNITGLDAALIKATARTLDAAAGAYGISGSDATLAQFSALAAEPGAYTLSGFPAEIESALSRYYAAKNFQRQATLTNFIRPMESVVYLKK